MDQSSDPRRYRDAKARKNYAGTSPITRASGTKKIVLTRCARNRRLGDARQQWEFCSIRESPGATAYYQQLRARNIGHHVALRQFVNPARRHPARLPQDPHHLRRERRLAHIHAGQTPFHIWSG